VKKLVTFRESSHFDTGAINYSPELTKSELVKNHVNNPILCMAQFGKKECWMLIVGG
jgi:hypothetical protein